MATALQLETLRKAVPAAQASARKYGVPASVTLAQWILESSWGSSQLTVQANNCFGVKRSAQTAPDRYVEMPTAEYQGGQRVLVQALFARYGSQAESFEAHARLLATAGRYRPAMASASHARAFAVALGRADYSTNPDYATELLQLMRLYNLEQYDQPPATHPATTETV